MQQIFASLGWTRGGQLCYACAAPSPACALAARPVSPPYRLLRLCGPVRAVLFALLVWLAPVLAFAQEVEAPVPPAVPPGVDRIEAVVEGGRVPFRGMLLDTDTAIRWTNALRWWPQEYVLVLRAHRRELALLEGSHERQLRIAEESYRREIDGLRADLQRQATQFMEARQANERAWHDTFGFGLTVGIVVAAVFAGVGVALGAAL